MNAELATAEPVTEIPWPDVSHLVTEDDTPVDNIYSEKQMRLLTRPLFTGWDPGVPFVAMANVGLYFSLNSPPYVPDVLLSMGVQLPENLMLKRNRSYFVGLHYDKVPDLIVEIVSNKEGGELDEKFRGYARCGVPYYVVYDPEAFIQKTPLRTFELDRSGRAPRYVAMNRPFFPMIQLGLTLWNGRFEEWENQWLRWEDAEGNLILLGNEVADAERKRANALRKRADAERKRANAEQTRAEKMAARLRAMGVDPDAD